MTEKLLPPNIFYPIAYPPDAPMGTPWSIPLPQDLTPFLAQHVTWHQYQVIIGLMMLLDSSGKKTCVTISDGRLAERIGLDKRDVQRSVLSESFQKLVTVTRGQGWKAGEKKKVTRYDLRPLFVSLLEWRTNQHALAPSFEEDAI